MTLFALAGRLADLLTITLVIATDPAAMSREQNAINAAAWHAAGLPGIALYWCAVTALLLVAVHRGLPFARTGAAWRGWRLSAAQCRLLLLAVVGIVWAGPVANVASALL